MFVNEICKERVKIKSKPQATQPGDYAKHAKYKSFLPSAPNSQQYYNDEQHIDQIHKRVLQGIRYNTQKICYEF